MLPSSWVDRLRKSSVSAETLRMPNSLPPPDEAALRKMFATAIVQCRAEWQWSQEELAERAGLSTTYISLLERGRRNLTVLVAAQIAAAFEMPLSALVNMAESHAT